MSKSIYEKSVKILNNYRNQNYNSTFRDEVELASAIDVILPKYVKQEKLLELYRKHYKLVPFMPGLGDNAKTVIDNSRKIEQIEKEIENDK